MSFEKFVLDTEVWQYIARMATPPACDPEMLALDEIAALPRDYLGEAHTLRHFRRELLTPHLALPDSHDAWVGRGRPDALELAHERLAVLQASASAPPLPEAVARRLAAL
jgi:trimethylamine--corrinoid protein Co-methyltransferase